jgi:PAS domain S-box-containing protein
MESQPPSDADIDSLAWDNPDTVIVVAGQDGKIVYCNPQTEKLSGYTKSELLSSQFIEFLHPQEQHRLSLLCQIQPAGKPVPQVLETRVITKGGQILPVAISRSITTWQNQPSDIITICDLTNRKQLELLVQSHTNTLDIFGQCLLITDNNLIILYASSAFLKLFRMNKQQVLKRRIEDLGIFDKPAMIKEIETTILIEGKTWQQKFSHRFENGQELSAWVDASPVFSQTRGIIGSTFVILEIKDLRAFDNQIVDQKEIMDSLVEGLATDANGIITYVSDRNSQRTGWHKEDRLGRSIFEFFPPDFQQKAREIIRIVLSHHNYSGELPIICPNGIVKHFMVHLKPVVNSDGRVTAIVGVTADLKETKDEKHQSLSRMVAKALVEDRGQNEKRRKIQLEVYSLGPLKVCSREKQIQHWPGKRIKSLFQYMISNKGAPLARDVLMETIWPNRDSASGVANLRMAIHGLRRMLNTLLDLDEGFPSVIFKDGCYLINPEIELITDVDNFEDLFLTGSRLERNGNPDKAMNAYQQALELYRGDYLEGEQFEDWVLNRREAILDTHFLILDRLAEHAFTGGDYDNCIYYCQKTITKDVCREDAYRRLMRCYSRLGERNRALVWFKTCRQKIKSALNVSLEDKTIELYKRLLNGQDI